MSWNQGGSIGSLVLLAGMFAWSMPAQTQLDLGRQSQKMAFDNANPTQPVRTAYSLPVRCTPGDMVLLAEEQPTGGFYLCKQTDQWQSQYIPWILPKLSGAILTGWRDAGRWLFPGGDVTAALGTMSVQKLRGLGLNASSPSSGDTLYWDGAQWSTRPAGSAGGFLTVNSGTRQIGQSGVLNFRASGAGLKMTATAVTNGISLNYAMDDSYVLTVEGRRKQTDLFCSATATAPGAEFSCTFPRPWRNLAAGAVLYLLPAVDAVPGMDGGISLQLDQLVAAPLADAAGGTALPSGEVKAGELRPIWYDGAKLRLVNSGRETVRTEARPGCGESQRGQIWRGAGGTGAKDEVAVCVRDEAGAYLWRILN